MDNILGVGARPKSWNCSTSQCSKAAIVDMQLMDTHNDPSSIVANVPSLQPSWGYFWQIGHRTIINGFIGLLIGLVPFFA